MDFAFPKIALIPYFPLLMNRLLRRVFVVLTLGGAFSGIVSVTGGIVNLKQRDFANYSILITVLLLYGYGVFAGLRLSERRRPDWHFLIYHLLQLLYLSWPSFAFHLFSGAYVACLLFPKFLWFFGFGNDWTLRTGGMTPWLFGINLFPIFALAYGFLASRRRRRTEARQYSPSNRILGR